MPNLGYTQAKWTDFMREFVQYMRIVRLLTEFGRRFREGRTRIYETYEQNNVLSAWTFVGAKREVNVDEDGRLYVTLTDESPGAGQATVDVYDDPAKAGGDRVATGNAADGATITLAQQNNSGLTGTVKLGTVTATDSDIVLILDIDEIQKGSRAFDLATLGGVSASKGYTALLQTVGNNLAAQALNALNDLRAKYIQVKGKEFLKSAETAVFTATEEADTNGDIQITLAGILADLKDAMEDNTTPQTIEKNTVTITAGPTYDGDNDGVGVLSVVASREQAPSGTVTLKCTAGAPDTLAETFSVELQVTKTNQVLLGRNELTIEKEWESQLIGHRLKLVRTIVDINDGSAQLDTWVIDGETVDNTNAGVLYCNLEAGAFAGGNNRRVRLYADSAKTRLVSEGLRVGNGVVTLLAMNGSGLTGSVNLTYTVDDTDIQVDLQPFSEGDIITFDVSNDLKGIIQTMFAEYFGISLPSAVPASATLKDDLIKESFDHLAAVS